MMLINDISFMGEPSRCGYICVYNEKCGPKEDESTNALRFFGIL